MKLGAQSIALDCPHCGVNKCQFKLDHDLRRGFTSVIMIEDGDGNRQPHSGRRGHLVYSCSNCHGHIYQLIEYWGSGSVTRGSNVAGMSSTPPAPAGSSGIRLVHQYPIATPLQHPSIPLDVKKASIEAEKCLVVGAYNACGTMARRAIDALCIERGGKGSVLFHRLRDLHEKHAITPDLWEWAEDLRIVGKSGAHPDVDAVSEDDARYAVRFLREIIRYVYVNPYERKHRKADD